MDPRVEWLGGRIGNSLGVFDKEYTDMLLNENMDQFKSFVVDEIKSVTEIDKRVVYVYRTFYDKLVESTITVLELVPPAPPPEITDTSKDKKGKKGKGKGKTKDNDGEVKPDQDYVAEIPDTPRSGN